MKRGKEEEKKRVKSECPAYNRNKGRWEKEKVRVLPTARKIKGRANHRA